MTRWRPVLPSTDNGRAVLVGLVGLAVGLALWWLPAAFIVPSGIILVMGLLTPPAEGGE